MTPRNKNPIKNKSIDISRNIFLLDKRMKVYLNRDNFLLDGCNNKKIDYSSKKDLVIKKEKKINFKTDIKKKESNFTMKIEKIIDGIRKERDQNL